MRRVLQMVVDGAHAIHKEALKNDVDGATKLNVKIAQLREAYSLLDESLTEPSVVGPQFREAMVIADFPYYFGTVLSKAFYEAYNMVPASWRDYTASDTVPDFRKVERYRTTEFETLLPIAELGQAKQTKTEDSKITYGVGEFARSFSISWRTIVNDDMGEIQRFPTKLLRAVTRFEDNWVSGLYDNATSQAALVALGANYAGAHALDVTGLKAAFEKFALRNDAQGNPINVRPIYIVTHPVHELTMRELLAGIDPTLNMPALTRVTKNLVQWRGDPYIGVTTDWYLLASPSDIPTITVARLRGYEQAQMYMKAPNAVPMSAGGGLGSPSWMSGDFDNGEITFQVKDIIGGWDDATYLGITDYQGIFYGHV